MLTKIELDGFKTFQNFELELGPFEVIVGANGSGKSNLFDALRLLSRLADAEGDLFGAFQGVRGETDQLFSLDAKGEPVETMRIAVEMLVEPKVREKQGNEVKLRYTRLRYEIKVRRIADFLGLSHHSLLHESLTFIPVKDDTWAQQFGLSVENGWLPSGKALTGSKREFIKTYDNNGKVMIRLQPDVPKSSKKQIRSHRTRSADKATATMLSSVTTTEFPHALAAREEMRSWQFLELNPGDLRGSRDVPRRTTLITNWVSDLPRHLALIKNENSDYDLLRDVSRDISGLVPGIVKIDLKKIEGIASPMLTAEMQDGRTFPWQALSDGTLRLLALVVLHNDPAHKGLLCFEEPENGVHPACLAGLARLLRDLATDFSQAYEEGQPLRQLLVNTQSPVFVSQREVMEVPNGILFAYIVNHVKPQSGEPPLSLTRIVPVRRRAELVESLQKKGEGNGSLQTETYSLNQIKRYLNTGTFEEARQILENGGVPS